MDNLKKKLSWLLVLMLVLTMMPVSALAAIPGGAPFTAITTDVGDAISVVEDGEVTVMYNTGTLYRVVIPEGATYAAVTLDFAFGDLMYYTDNAGNPTNIAGYKGDAWGEDGGYASFECISSDTSTTVIKIPVEDLIWSEEDNFYAAGPEYADFAPVCFFTFEYGEAAEEEPEEPVVPALTFTDRVVDGVAAVPYSYSGISIDLSDYVEITPAVEGYSIKWGSNYKAYPENDPAVVKAAMKTLDGNTITVDETMGQAKDTFMPLKATLVDPDDNRLDDTVVTFNILPVLPEFVATEATVKPGNTINVPVRANASAASIGYTYSWSYTSSDAENAPVAADGTVTGKTNGTTATITVTEACGATASYQVNVRCDHRNTETTTAYAPVEGSEQHTVTVTCNVCGEQVGEVETVDCTDEDSDGVCDDCLGDVTVPALLIVSVDGAAVELKESIDQIYSYPLFYASYPMGKDATVTTGNGSEVFFYDPIRGFGLEDNVISSGVVTEHGWSAADFNSYNLGAEIAETSTGLYFMVADQENNQYVLVIELTVGGEAPACEHSETTTVYAQVAGSEKHNVTVTCDACDEQIGEATVADCADADKNGKCDLCGGDVTVVVPAVPITKISFWDERDKPYTELNINIGEAVDAVACCTPKATTENVVLFSSGDSEIFIVETPEVTADEKGHAPGTIKGVKAGTATLTATSKTNPEVYATCTINVACNHVGTELTPSYSYEIVGGGVHNILVKEYCECGELAKTSTILNDECVDENANGECDLCKGTVEEPAEDIPNMIFDSSVHGAWGSSITFKKLFVSGVKVKSYEWNNGACIVTLDKNTPADAVMTFSVEGLGGGAPGSAAFYVNGSKTNLTAQLENGKAVVEIRAAHTSVITTQASAKNISFITEGAELVPVESIVITPENPRVVANGSLQLTATVYPENATVKDVKWSTSAASTNMTINETGKVMGQTMGMGGHYTVTATSVSNPEISASCKVFLDWKPEDSITISKETMTVKIGESGKLSATVSGSQFVTNTAVTWSSSDESIATVDSGKVTGLKTGTVTITATSYYGLTASCEVTVTCGHVGMETTMVYTQIENTETHTAATTCVCGHVLGTATEKCVDEDADGVCDKCNGAVEVPAPETKPGDLSGDGEITSDDLSAVKLSLSGKKTLTESEKKAADVNSDGEITSDDIAAIKLHLSGKKALF